MNNSNPARGSAFVENFLAERAANRRAAKQTSGFACMECGHKFKTVKAAERASFGDKGCPKCGGSDIDLQV